MKNILTILKKELKRFFTDYRMIITLVSPGILIFVLYTLMGSFISDASSTNQEYEYQIVVVNQPSEEHFNQIVDFDLIGNPINLVNASSANDSYLTQLENEEIDLYIIYPDNFYDDAIAFDPTNNDPNNIAPDVKVYFNYSKIESYTIFEYYTFLLDGFKDDISMKFTVDRNDLSQPEDGAIIFITTLVPFLLVIFLYSGAMSVSIESIAGEKERGTIATILATPIKRRDLVLGKVFALTIASLVGATSSFLGLMLSLPNLAGANSGLNFNIYGAGEFILLFLVIATTTVLYVVLISMISTFSKSVKEASGMSAILMIFNMAISVTSMAGNVNQNTYAYFIPVYNSLQSFTSILSLDVNMLHLGITVISNVVYIAMGVYILSRMFNSEKVMFNK